MLLLYFYHTYIAFKVCNCYQFMHSPRIEPITKVLQATRPEYVICKIQRRNKEKKKDVHITLRIKCQFRHYKWIHLK